MILFLGTAIRFICNPARHFRRKPSKKYAERFIQDVDYIEFFDDKYKYMMIRDRAVMTSITGLHIEHEFFELIETGLLYIRTGYKWDGPSGPTVDTPSFMRASAAHDVKFQMMREGLIKDSRREMFFKQANEDMERDARQDGMLHFRADYCHWSVDKFGEKHTIKKAA